MWQWASATGILVFGLGSALHALLNKRDPRAALNWIFICLLVPGFGGVAYWILGVNRIRTKAKGWREEGRFSLGAARDYTAFHVEGDTDNSGQDISSFMLLSEKVCRTPLLAGNSVVPLFNGEEAYPAMLEAIEKAKKHVFVCTYIFDTDDAGLLFVKALGEAAGRGVDVRVIIDAIGERYSRPRVRKLLKEYKSVRVARFLPLAISLRGLRLNLRNHRKLLTVDGEVGFTGGMNIGQRHMVEDEKNKNRTADVHFKLLGPVVSSLEDMFYEDWGFSTGEKAPVQKVEAKVAGDALCRSVPDGPNEDFEVLQWMIVGALSCANHHVRIMTPYFIPGRELLSALHAAALRGVQVDIMLPAKNNLPIVKWASRAFYPEVTRYGCRVYLQPPPFNHSKVIVIDSHYTILGSANLDPRSLRLNFEYNLEVFDEKLAARLTEHFERLREKSELIDSDTYIRSGFFARTRDSVAKLGAPYL